MASKSSRSSHTSLISIDPAIASHITGVRTMAHPSHTRTESTPVKGPNNPAIAQVKGHGRNNSAPGRNHKRSNSLRRAKNSTEMLRQRSTRKEKQGSGEPANDSKRGRNFAVTNVGTGGTLYLRPSAHQTSMSPAISPPPSTPWTAPATTLLMPQDNEALLLKTQHNPLGRGPTSRTRSVSPKRLMERFNKSKEAQAAAARARPSHGRSLSFSTMDESRKSISDTMPKTLKIVINRADEPRPKTSESSKPTLEIPIPHYRLGNPRFSSNGTPILRSSTFTRASSTPSTKRASSVKIEAPSSAPPPASLKAFAKLQSMDPTPDIVIEQEPKPPEKLAGAAAQRQSAVTSIGAAPSIYDDLSEVYNDPSVVRFAHDIREITAATPARIIAQISSESFMDYELVSDFFLTFRSYMSTLDVLNLLLARLKWAIGRMTDDGRIIRIRTFAALRHWILNYFMDDFVPVRYLRERFCDEVNEMYDEVSGRYMGGHSDLKILQDLKRCWNGRCLLYWDGEEFSMDNSPDEEIFPGGVLGSRNPDYIEVGQVRPAPGQAAFHAIHTESHGSAVAASPETPKDLRREHKALYTFSAPAESVQSEQSIQPNSCSVPIGSNRNFSTNQRTSKGPHPVSVLARRQNAPAELTVSTNLSSSQKNQHKRGGSSIDSTREKTLVEVPKSAIILQEPFEGSIIRGYVFGPVEPFVQISANLPMSPSARFDLASPNLSAARPQPDYGLNANTPAVKNIFGSIRRALSGKQGPSDVALIAVSTQSSSSSQMLPGKKSPMPLNVSRSQDELRRKAAGSSSKGNIRIDLLCAAAIESYQISLPPVQHMTPSTARPETAQTDPKFPSPPTKKPPVPAIPPSHSRRIASDNTAESGSILIVNDTQVEIPVMSGALVQPRSSSQRTHSSSDHYLLNDGASFETQIALEKADQGDQNLQDSPESNKPSVDRIAIPPSTPEPDRVMSSTASTTTVRNRHSLSSSVPPNRILASPGATASVVTPPQDYHDDASIASPKGPAHTLRRRPGGDLRKNQNVHDLEPTHAHHESYDSQPNTASTRDGSVITTGNKPSQQYRLQAAKKISMINTHSSQHLRPSFEAAVAGFSDIPDDDDGGLEATLLKLEGRWDKKSPSLRSLSSASSDEDPFPISTASAGSFSIRDSPSPIVSRGYTHKSVLPPAPEAPQLRPYSRNLTQALQEAQRAGFRKPSRSLAQSVASDNSIPLLKRGTVMSQPKLPAMLKRGSASQATSSSKRTTATTKSRAARSVYEISAKTSSIVEKPKDQAKDSASSHDSDDNGDVSDLSSELSVDIVNYSEAMGSANSPLLVAPGTAVSGLEIPSHPLAHSSFVNISLHPSLALDGKTPRLEHSPSPEPSSSVLLKAANGESIAVKRSSLQQSPIGMQRGGRITAGPAHIPFILACDSQILAQQLTLVEQSALTEIEWSDLVEMRWNNTAASILDWAEYVARQDVKGVDLVITRFNLVVKWALSEIVLTQDIEERVKVITKLIHVAAHARRLHNYGTMLQLTIALTSTDCTRMTKTWEQVPGPDKSLLKNMESLIQPIRNFHDLRLEMESADLSDGCIPFIGLYIHDLTYNSQKPVEIDIGKGQPPLINFERFRTAAVIVKGLLRLIDASSRYDFEPIHGVIERCLWIAALSDERIRALSKALQQ